MSFKDNPIDLLKNEIIRNEIDVVMTGGVSTQFKSIKEIIDISKEVNPDIIAVVGGVIVSADPITAMEAFENADYGVIGEAEITVNSLSYALETRGDAAGEDGTICWRNGEWLINEKFTYVPDINILPFPDYEGFE